MIGYIGSGILLIIFIYVFRLFFIVDKSKKIEIHRDIRLSKHGSTKFVGVVANKSKKRKRINL